MRYLIVTIGAVVALAVSGPAYAQRPSMDVAGGYAYLHEKDLHIPAGWFASVGGNVNDWFTIEGAVSGHYKTVTESGLDVNTKMHTFVVGPKLISRANPKILPYGQVLFGGARATGGVNVANVVDVSVSTNGFDVQPGAGIEIKTNDNFGLRVGVNADWIRSEGEWNNEFQFVVGVVFHP